MIDKITVNIGGFAIRPSENDAYNQPIGLAFDNADNGGLDVALAEHGHHQELYRAYLTTLSKTHRHYMPSSYEHAAAAFGFLVTVIPTLLLLVSKTITLVPRQN